MSLHLQDMVVADLPAVVDLDSMVAQRPWSREMFLEELRLQSFCRVLLAADGVLVGFCVSRLLFDEWHLLTVGVGLKVRQRGYGQRLLGDIINKATLTHSRCVLLEVRVSNSPAQNLYKKMGFKTLCIRDNYYKSPPGTEDAVVMELPVGNGG
jgi:[ribosomal protein S18]-alanine N-acetyltransferase